MLQAIVFDFDGVIVDSEPMHYHAFVEVGRGIGFEMDYPTYLERYIGFDDRDAFREMLHELGRPAEDGLIRELGEAKAEVFETLVAKNTPAIPGTLELIDQAKAAGLPIAIASGATALDIRLMLNALGRVDDFPIVVSADDVARSKPDPASYALAVEKLAALHEGSMIAPGSCLAIEDTAAGIRSAKSAGLMTLGITTTGSADALAEAHRVIENLQGTTLDQLKQWYGGDQQS